MPPAERQITHAPHGHILTNINVWSPDGRWIVYTRDFDRGNLNVIDNYR